MWPLNRGDCMGRFDVTVVTQTIFLEVLQYCNHQPHFFAHLFKTIWPFYHHLSLVPIYLPSLLIIQFSPVNTKGIQFDSDDSRNLDIHTETNETIKGEIMLQWKKPPLAKSEKRKNSACSFVYELDNPATKHREASSDYFALAPVNQLDEVVSQSMIP